MDKVIKRKGTLYVTSIPDHMKPVTILQVTTHQVTVTDGERVVDLKREDNESK